MPRVLLRRADPPRAPELIDLRRENMGSRLLDPWRTLFGHPDRSLRVQAKPRYRSGDLVEILAPAQPLKKELEAFACAIATGETPAVTGEDGLRNLEVALRCLGA